MRYETFSAEETRALGEKLAEIIKPGDIVAFEGGLGSGKTEMIRGCMMKLNPDAIVRSPSFSLVHSYPTNEFAVHHFDFYRLNVADELWEIGYEEYLSADAVCFIEWAQMFEESLPKNTRYIKFVEATEDRRIIESDLNLS